MDNRHSVCAHLLRQTASQSRAWSATVHPYLRQAHFPYIFKVIGLLGIEICGCGDRHLDGNVIRDMMVAQDVNFCREVHRHASIRLAAAIGHSTTTHSSRLHSCHSSSIPGHLLTIVVITLHSLLAYNNFLLSPFLYILSHLCFLLFSSTITSLLSDKMATLCSS